MYDSIYIKFKNVMGHERILSVTEVFLITHIADSIFSLNFIVSTKSWFLVKGKPRAIVQPSFCCCLIAKSLQLFCDPMDCRPQESSDNGISQARILEWIAISFSRGSSWPRDQALVSCTGRQVLYHWATREAQISRMSRNKIWLK